MDPQRLVVLPRDALKVAHLAGTVVAAIEVAIIAKSNGSTKTPVAGELSIAAIEVAVNITSIHSAQTTVTAYLSTATTASIASIFVQVAEVTRRVG